MRTLITTPPFTDNTFDVSWIDRGNWPVSWIASPEAAVPYVCAFRRRFTLEVAQTIRIHVTADERYELYLDGARIGRGPERGDPRNWFFETYDLPLKAGEHVLAAKTWALGVLAPRSQMSVAPGFLLAPDDASLMPLLGTGLAAWETRLLGGYTYQRPFAHPFFSIGWGTTLEAAEYPWGWERGKDDAAAWQPAQKGQPGATKDLRNRYPHTVHLLTPATLPPLREEVRALGKTRQVSAMETDFVEIPDHLEAEAADWDALLHHERTLTIPPHTFRRVIVDLEDYLCAYPEAILSGGRGAELAVRWAESLYLTPEGREKGHRGEIEGKYFIGYGDVFRPDGAAPRAFDTLYWRSGRYLELRVRTGAESLVIERLALRETHYPLACDCEFSASDERLGAIFQVGLRTLRASAHDAFMDGPYCEQMMWAGDAVQNTLVAYMLTRDDRLTRKLLVLFNSSRLPNGLTAARWPAKDFALLMPYCLLWIAILREFAYWRDDAAFVKSLMPGVRATVEAMFGFLNAEGLWEVGTGWNFTDWVTGWPSGIAPGADHGVSSVLNWQFVKTLEYAAQLEDAHGEPELAVRARRKAGELAQRLNVAFWDDARGLYVDDPTHASASEHAQIEALLSGALNPARQARLANVLFTDADLTRTTISYSHYLFEACQSAGRVDALFERLHIWHDALAVGLLTTPESPEPTRSDCHAWGAHPIYHYFATLLGIRPAEPGFKSVRITPQLGPLDWGAGRLVHPCGEITMEIHRDHGGYRGKIHLPQETSGQLHALGKIIPLHPGHQEFVFPSPR